MELRKLPFFVRWCCIGMLLGVGFVLPLLWPLGIVGIAAFIAQANAPKTKRQYLGAWIAWTIKSAFALVWFWYVYPIEWLAFDLGNIQLPLIFLYWFTASIWLGSGGIVALMLIRYFKENLSKELLIGVAIAVSWVGAEILGSVFFSVITIGEGGIVTSAFSFGFIGYLLAHHSLLLYGAKVAGVYSLGCIAASIGYFLYQKHSYVKNNVVFTLLVCATIYISGFVPTYVPPANPNGYEVMVVNTEFPPNQIRTIEGVQLVRQHQTDIFKTSLTYEPDYVLWPEDARAMEFLENQNFHIASNTATVVIDSTRVDTEEHTYLEARVYQPGTAEYTFSHKRYLVPQGEFMPALYIGTLKLLGYDRLVERVAKDVSYEVGPKTSQIDFPSNTPAVLFCFESVSPYGVMSLLSERNNVPFIAHPISHSWFHTPTILWQNLDTMLQVQAIWSGKYIVSAGSHATGMVYSPYGEVLSMETVAVGSGWVLNKAVIPYE